MASQRAPLITRAKSEVERMIEWMEDNPEDLKGRQLSWHKDVKDDIFKNDAHIIVKRICDEKTMEGVV